MADDFSSYQSSLTSPAREAVAIVPSDSQSLASPVRGLYVGGSGTLRVRMLSGTVANFSGVTAGVVYPFRITQVMAAGTSATGLVGLS